MFSLTEVSYHSHLPDNKIKVRSQNINNFKNYSLVLFADPPWNAGCLSCCHTRGVCEESILPVGFLAFSIIVPILPSRELWGWIEFIYSEMFRFFLSDQTAAVCCCFFVISHFKGICPLSFKLSCCCWGPFGLPEAIRCPNSHNNRNNIFFCMLNSSCLIVTSV